VAHRGLTSRDPENSLASIKAALSAGLDFIEVDVRATKDASLVLLHDSTLERTTDSAGRITDLTAAQSQSVRLQDGSRLPTLESALALCGLRATLCLDVKDALLIEPLIRALKIHEGPTEVWSEHLSVVRACSANGLPAALICNGLLPRGIGAFIWQARDAGATGVSFYPADIEPHVAAACRHAAMPFLCGTPNDEATWLELVRQGIRGIITDRPLDCIKWHRSLQRITSC
jgi:glycerophosphoryl diester phosphodiesterase